MSNRILVIASTVAMMATAAMAQTNCNQPAAEAITYVELPANPFTPVPSKDGCWMFVSLVGRNGPQAGVAVLRRDRGKVTVERVVPTAGSPTGLVLTHDGKTLIGAMDDRIVFLDTARMISGKGEIAPSYIPLPEYHAGLGGMKVNSPGAVYVNVTRDGRYVFVSDEWAARIEVIDARKKSIIGTIPTGRLPIAVTLSPGDRYLYGTAETAAEEWNWPAECKEEGRNPATAKVQYPQGAVVVVDVARAKTDPAHAVVAKAPAGCSAVRLALSPDGNTAYVTARNSNAMLAFDTARLRSDPEHAMIGKVPVGMSPVGIEVAADGAKIFVANSNRFARGNENQWLSVIDAAKVAEGAAAAVRTIPAGAFPRELRLTTDGKTLLITNFGSKTLEMVDLARVQ